MEKINEPELLPNHKMYFSENEENDKGENERDPVQKPNTGDWGEEREDDEIDSDSEHNRGNDNSGGAGSTGSASTNS